jgi:hypothetical protein
MSNIISNHDIEIAKSNLDAVKQTAAQVIKDFATFSIEIEFPENLNLAYDELFDQVNDCIHSLLYGDREKLMSLLYRIDLSEANMKTARSAIDQNTEAVIISELILHRELQKVLIRNYFSRQNNTFGH